LNGGRSQGKITCEIETPGMKGYFDEKSLEAYNLLIADREGVDFSEGEIYDFTRCVRANGSFYGTSGRCRQGSPAGPKEETEGNRSLLPTQADKEAALKAVRDEAAKRAAAGDDKGVDAAIKAYNRIKKGATREEGTSGINLSKVKAAKEKLAADKAANGGKRLDRIQEEQRLARNKAQRELDAKGKAKSPADLATPQKQGKADVDRMKKYLQDESDKLKNLNDAQKQNPGRSNDPDVASRKAVLERNVAAVKNQLKELEGKL